MRPRSSSPRRDWAVLALAGLAAAAPISAIAQEEPADEVVLAKHDPNNADVFKFDFSVPSSPALTLLGVDKDKVTQSNSLKPFVISLPDVFSSEETGQAVALDISPAWLFVPKAERRAERYSGAVALGFRTRMAVAILEGVNDDDAEKRKASRLALGVSTSVLRHSDPLLASAPGRNGSAWASCADSATAVIQNTLGVHIATPEETDLRIKVRLADTEVARLEAEPQSPERDKLLAAARGALQEAKTKFDAAFQANEAKARDAFKKTAAAQMYPVCVKVADLAARLGQDLDVGAGAVWRGDPGKLQGLSDPGGVVWASYRRTFGANRPAGDDFESLKKWESEIDPWVTIGISGRIGADELISTGDDITPEIRADTYSIWGGVEWNSKSTRLALQVGQEKTSPRRDAEEAFEGSRTRYLAALDRRLGDTGAWISISYGHASGRGSVQDDKTARVTLTFTEPKARNMFGP